MKPRLIVLLFTLSFWLTAACLAQAPAQSGQSSEPNFTADQQIDFLLHAKVVSSKVLGKGITHPWRLTLTDGQVTHDAAFQVVDERDQKKEFEDGHTELNFVDSYHYDIAGYDLASMLGMDDMIPVYVEREWNRQKGRSLLVDYLEVG